MHKEYRIHRLARNHYQVSYTHGLLDVRHVCWRQNKTDAKAAVIEHAAKNGFKAMIVYS